MRVYIAGHSGMVGSALVRTLPQGYELLTVERAALDLENRGEVRNFLRKNEPDLVILAAAKVGGIISNSRNQREFLISNLRIQDSVVTSAADLGVPNLIFLGSSCIYPKLSSQPISEQQLLTGALESSNEAYALAKIAGVKLCRTINEESGLNYFSVMPTNLYGPRDNFDLETSHVPAALMRKFHEAKLSNSKAVEVWGTGTPRREFMHVDDLAQACWHLLGKVTNGDLINVGTGKDLPISDFARMMAEIVGFQGEITFDLSKPDGTPQKLLDNSKVHSYGWQHQIELQDGLEQTYVWFVNALKRGEVRGY